MLGAIDQSYLFDILTALQANNGAALIEKAQQMEARSISFEAALNDLANLLHQIAMAQTVPDSIANDLPERGMLLDLAAKLSPETLQLYYQITLLGRRDIGLAPDEYAGFTMTLLRMLAFSPTGKIAEKITEKSQERTTTKPTENVQTAAQIQPVAAPAKQAEPEKIEAELLKPIEKDALQANIHAAPGSIVFDGNWKNLVEQNLKLGLARALAQNCELIGHDENNFTLRVAESQKHLVSGNYQDKLSSAINEYFGKKIRLIFEIDAMANTPAKQNATEKANVQSGAEAAIMGDPFVQDLMQKFGAQIIPNSIKTN